MRRIVMFNRVTADAYFAAPNGGLEWAVPDEEFDKEVASEPLEVDTILLGRRTYEMFAQFWPHVSAATPNPHGGGPVSPETLAMAKALNEGTKLVFSRGLKDVSWKNSRLLRDLDPREIERLKRQSGKDMIVLGSGSIVSQLTEYGLIDEYQFLVSPILLGQGRPLFQEVSTSSTLNLLEAKSYRSGNVMLHYARAS